MAIYGFNDYKEKILGYSMLTYSSIVKVRALLGGAIKIVTFPISAQEVVASDLATGNGVNYAASFPDSSLYEDLSEYSCIGCMSEVTRSSASVPNKSVQFEFINMTYSETYPSFTYINGIVRNTGSTTIETIEDMPGMTVTLIMVKD